MFKIWLLIVFNWLFVYGTPILSGYFLLLSKKPTTMTGFFYLVVATVIVIFFKKISIAIKKMKASYTKAIFKLFLTCLVLYCLWVFISYIGVNFTEIAKVVAITIGGRIIGFVLEMFAIKLNATYIDEIGVI